MTSTSYLQTLPQSEAIAFVTSLQKVKEHLSQELEWINTQLQQKTVQLQGIEAILSELEPPEEETETGSTSGELTNGNTSISRLLDLEISTAPLQAASSSDSGTEGSQRGKKQNSRSKSSSRLSARQKRGAVKPASKAKSPGAATEPNALRPFLQSAFQNQPLSDSIVQVLSSTAEPLSADNLMVELYEGLSSEDYRRAKRSLTNILSTGRSKGKWRSAERGLYAGNEVALA